MKTFIVSLLVVLTVSACTTKKPEVFATDEGAIRGYDAVAYFTESKAVKGSKQYSTVYNEATWCFVSEENLAAFKASPEKYVPQFGGYCAYAVSQDYTYETDPHAFTIVNDKLYLNYDLETSKEWNLKHEEYILMANKNWPEVLRK
jgi:YHS domain-containing protein